MDKIATRIFDYLEKSQMDQKTFAAKIGASEKIVSKWRTSGLKSYRKYLPEIANVFNISVDYLLGEKEAEKFTLSDIGTKKLDPDKTIILIEQKPDGTLDATPVVQEISSRDARLLAWFRSLSPEKQKAILISQDAPEDVQ